MKCPQYTKNTNEWKTHWKISLYLIIIIILQEITPSFMSAIVAIQSLFLIVYLLQLIFMRL